MDQTRQCSAEHEQKRAEHIRNRATMHKDKGNLAATAEQVNRRKAAELQHAQEVLHNLQTQSRSSATSMTHGH